MLLIWTLIWRLSICRLIFSLAGQDSLCAAWQANFTRSGRVNLLVGPVRRLGNATNHWSSDAYMNDVNKAYYFTLDQISSYPANEAMRHDGFPTRCQVAD